VNADRSRLGDYEFDVINLDDLIRIKQHIGRPKDKDSLRELLSIKERRRLSGEE
jgi:predicted nucleotidyltransferase